MGNLKVITIRDAAREAVIYIDKRRKGEIKSLKTPWDKYNSVALGGIEWNTIHTIAGASGSGKTAILNQLETSLIELNPIEEFDILSFNFEMLARNLITRKLSNKLDKTTQQLLSGEHNGVPVTDTEYAQIIEEGKKFASMNIFYVDVPGTPEDIHDTVISFVKNRPSGRGLIVLLDHTILVKGKGIEKERATLVELMTMFNTLKKQYKICFVILSQLNRESESVERLNEPMHHYPKKRDLFGSDSIYQFSDVVSVIVNPEFLGLETYGPKGLPVKGFLYWHFLKVREGSPCIAKMYNKLKYNKVEDAI